MAPLVFCAALLRLLGAVFRGTGRPAPRAGAGWLLCCTGGWLAAGAAGAWSPVWPVLILAALGTLAERTRHRRGARVLGDLAVAVTTGLSSIPPLSPAMLLALVVGVGLYGVGVDRIFSRVPGKIVIVGTVVLVAVLASTAALAFDRISARSEHLGAGLILSTGVSAGFSGERMDLDDGLVVWLNRPAGAGTFPGVVLFHGNDLRGSHQRSACILRRALVDAGMVVLAVDAPGYGESRPHRLDAPVDAWDPLPHCRLALSVLRSRPYVGKIILVGHSMGCGSVLSLLADSADSAGGVLLGASLGSPGENERYWYERFHWGRAPGERMPIEKWRELCRRFRNARKSVESLPEDHAPILFGRFGLEHDDIRSTRDAFYAAIPGRKLLWDLERTTHYFNSIGAGSLLIGDTRVASKISSRILGFLR